MLFRSLLLSLLVVSSATAAPEYKWEKIEGCTLVPGEWKDGDSFTVRIAPRTFRVFRLYFVDTPEDGVDKRFPERIEEQAKYFGVTTDRVIQVGDDAAAFTAKTLGAKPFTIYTLWQDALGASKRQRFYAIIETSEGSLAELLVKNGLARIYGKRIQLPDGSDSRTYLEKLAEMKEAAMAAKKGGWAVQ